jgi:hypothetical protein
MTDEHGIRVDGQSVKQGIPLQIEVESVAREAANAA